VLLGGWGSFRGRREPAACVHQFRDSGGGGIRTPYGLRGPPKRAKTAMFRGLSLPLRSRMRQGVLLAMLRRCPNCHEIHASEQTVESSPQSHSTTRTTSAAASDEGSSGTRTGSTSESPGCSGSTSRNARRAVAGAEGGEGRGLLLEPEHRVQLDDHRRPSRRLEQGLQALQDAQLRPLDVDLHERDPLEVRGRDQRDRRSDRKSYEGRPLEGPPLVGGDVNLVRAVLPPRPGHLLRVWVRRPRDALFAGSSRQFRPPTSSSVLLHP
jgi:hypothetical protein